VKEFLRIAGAQIPVTADMATNVQTIKDAIDWASENKVDYLVTPEASITGYVSPFTEERWPMLVDSLQTIEKYSEEKEVGLCLGTFWAEAREEGEFIRLNQLRVYHKGNYGGCANKSFLCPDDYRMGIAPNEELFGFLLDASDDTSEAYIQSAGLLCKDLYARESASETDLINLPVSFYRIGCQLYIHATNAERGIDSVHDDVHYHWHTANAEMVSWITKRPLITVDNSIKMNGDAYDGRTSSPSGVLICGEWVVRAPECGKHYFYYDFPVAEFGKMDWTKYMQNRKAT